MGASVYLIVTGALPALREMNEQTLRDRYVALDIRAPDNPGSPEQLGTMAVEGGGLRSITGTSRAGAERLNELPDESWLSISDEWPSDWVYPD